MNYLRIDRVETARAWINKHLIRKGVWLEDVDGIYEVIYVDTDYVHVRELGWDETISDFVPLVDSADRTWAISELVGKVVE